MDESRPVSTCGWTLLPPHYPNNIPTIPFYYTLLPLFKEVDQEELYHKYLKEPLTKWGAVKIFFGGHWNVLITRPEYMAQVLKNDEDFPKVGNHVKNPHSVLALYTGENIISAIGDTWRHFATICKPGLQSNVEFSIMTKNAHVLIGFLLREQQRTASVDMLDYVQAYTIANAERNKPAHTSSAGSWKPRPSFAETAASEYHFEQNVLITFVAGHENPMILILSNLLVLADRQELQEKVRREVMSLPIASRTHPDALATLPLLTAIIYETLRMYPPLSQIMNKRTTADVILGEDILLPAGTYTGYNGYSTNRNREFWGLDADVFRPSRWGETVDDMNILFRRATSKAAFITFHGGKRTCLGQKWALAAHRVTMSIFLTSIRWRPDPSWPRRMTPAGPLMPKNLRLQLERIEVSDRAVHLRRSGRILLATEKG
ncbi:hypothetical protein O1611_g340 [Lasiodiplodia mahajangana]|uniref:Uncharacterized protein n=1 Tax=Lasiodiplodia mahajangana TaxID=1108764 RepID=A0ACC2K0G1_9PEZI|nr:hypothetical protein O1611_g340 [Lasiodiplodia mahajangana]